MTFDERVTAVSEFGFTTRQARFLVTVMLHGGVCVPRQYARFAGIAYGHKVNVFFDKLVSMRYAVGCRCVHNRAAVYHVHHQPLYRVIGEPHNRNRKPVTAPRVIERLMLLDAVNSHPELRWLATATDKVVYFRSASPSGTSLWPQHTVARTRRYFQDHLPIGVSPTGRVVFVFLATTPMTDNLKAFLGRHVDLLQALPDWTVPLSELQRTRNVTFVFEPRSDQAWRRVVEAWQYPGRERPEPGFIVFAGTNDYWLHPFSSLGISVRVTQDRRFLDQLPGANGVYGYSSKSTDYGVHFSPLSSADVRVEIEAKSPVELPAGELLVAPDWVLVQ